jgi:hypothetical protein
LPIFPFEGDNLSTSATDVRIYIKCLPEMIDRGRTRLRANIKQYANVGLEDWTKGIEKPSVMMLTSDGGGTEKKRADR